MNHFLVFTLLFGATVAQFEEKASVPVDVSPSAACENGEPEIIRQPEPIYIVDKLGKSLKIECAAYGLPSPLVYWVKGKMDLTENEKRIPATGIGASILYFDSIDAEDIDYYTCVVEDCCRGSVQTFETEIRLNIKNGCTRRQSEGYYRVIWQYTNWTDAFAYCTDNNMEFAVPKSEEENAALYAAVSAGQTDDPNGKKFAHHNMVWMGLTDGYHGAKDVFNNINDDSEAEYYNWMDKQPDNWQKYDETGQDVVAMDKNSGEWDDSYGFWKRPFACYCPGKAKKSKKNKKN